MSTLLPKLAELIGADPAGLPEVEIHGVASIREACPGDVTFLTSRRYLPYLENCAATAVIVPREEKPGNSWPIRLEVSDPQAALISTVRLFHPDRREAGLGVHPRAEVSSQAEIGRDVSIHAHAVVRAGARIGDRSILYPGVYVGENSVVGADALIYPNVVLREGVELGDRVIVHAGVVIGADGFGFAPAGGGNAKIPQVGRVLIGDDVEIGANTTIDRATLGATVIGAGTKIDNLVQIGHNVKVGRDTVMCAQVGVAGSVEIGNGVVIAGQAGIIGHIRLGNRVVVGGQSGVVHSVEDGECIVGQPAKPHRDTARQLAAITRLPKMLAQVRNLERRLAELEQENARIAALLAERQG